MGCFSPTKEQMYFQYKISEFQKAGQTDRLTVKDKDKERGREGGRKGKRVEGRFKMCIFLSFSFLAVGRFT